MRAEEWNNRGKVRGQSVAEGEENEGDEREKEEQEEGVGEGRRRAWRASTALASFSLGSTSRCTARKMSDCTSAVEGPGGWAGDGGRVLPGLSPPHKPGVSALADSACHGRAAQKKVQGLPVPRQPSSPENRARRTRSRGLASRHTSITCGRAGAGWLAD